jgi:hypothetical protein
MLKRLFNFWHEDRSLSVFLICLVACVFVIYPLARQIDILRMTSGIILSLILAGGLFAMTERKILRVSIAVFIILYLAVHWLRVSTGNTIFFLTEAVLTILFATSLLAIVLWHVFRPGPVTAHRVRGAVAGYLLLSVIFSLIYALIEYVSPRSFQFATPSQVASNFMAQDFMYFSTVTLTTLGYGDITPLNPFARTFVMFEAFTGQLYPAILIARLVSLSVDSRGQGKTDGITRCKQKKSGK